VVSYHNDGFLTEISKLKITIIINSISFCLNNSKSLSKNKFITQIKKFGVDYAAPGTALPFATTPPPPHTYAPTHICSNSRGCRS
jgi:hypothetical protein